jgi:hypothetical protein
MRGEMLEGNYTGVLFPLDHNFDIDLLTTGILSSALSLQKEVITLKPCRIVLEQTCTL